MVEGKTAESYWLVYYVPSLGELKVLVILSANSGVQNHDALILFYSQNVNLVVLGPTHPRQAKLQYFFLLSICVESYLPSHKT